MIIKTLCTIGGQKQAQITIEIGLPSAWARPGASVLLAAPGLRSIVGDKTQ
jgi:hypothetical protein